jgi:pyrroloquinoline quinone (PQQ) biosynthesis protein C
MRPGELEIDLRRLTDAMYERPPAPGSPISKLVEGRLTLPEARTFWGNRWHVGLAYNQIVLPRLLEKCPEVDARVQLFQVIAYEYGAADLSKSYLSMYRSFLLALGLREEDVPWECDVRRRDVIAHLEKFDSLDWIGHLVLGLLGIRSVGSRTYGIIAVKLREPPFSLGDDALAFFTRHAERDALDSDIVFEMVARYARTLEEQNAARDMLVAFSNTGRFSAYCCALAPSTFRFSEQPGGVPYRLLDPVPIAMRSKS